VGCTSGHGGEATCRRVDETGRADDGVRWPKWRGQRLGLYGHGVRSVSKRGKEGRCGPRLIEGREHKDSCHNRKE
jgi:hypothetical protein